VKDLLPPLRACRSASNCLGAHGPVITPPVWVVKPWIVLV